MMKKTFLLLSLLFYVSTGSAIYASGQMEAVTENDNRSLPRGIVIVDRSYDVFHKITQSYEKGELDLSSWADKDASCLYCYQLSKEDCCKLGLQNADGISERYAKVDITKGVEQFISQLKVHLPNLKQLLFRGQEWRFTYTGEIGIAWHVTTIAREVYFALKNEGYEVTLHYSGEYDSHVDLLLKRWPMRAEQFCGFLRMAWLAKSTDDLLNFMPSLDYDYEQGDGRFAHRIVDGYDHSRSFMPKYEETKECLHKAIAAYTRIAKDNLGLSMILHTDIPACDVALERVMRFIYLAASKKAPTLLDTIVRIHELRLYYGTDLMNSYFDGSEGGLNLHLICHDDTEAILMALRGFIPDWTQDDFGQEYLKAKNNNELFRRMPHHGDLEASEVYMGAKAKKITRSVLFWHFCRTLAPYDQTTQLIRLQRLLKVLQLTHIQTVDGLEEQLHRVLGYLYEETQNMPDVDAFLTQKRVDGFNPLRSTSLFFLGMEKCNLL